MKFARLVFFGAGISLGLPLGIRGGTFSDRTIAMPRGSRLVLYSDGVTEAVNAALEEYGARRLQEHFRQSDATADTLLEEVRITSV